MKTGAKKHLPQHFQTATLIFASVILLACDDATGPQRDQGDRLASDAAVGSVTGFITARGQPVSGLTVIISQDGTIIQVRTTGPDGEYSFHGLPVGDYDIQLTQRLGRFNVPDIPLRGARWSVSVRAGTNASADFDLYGETEEFD